jgi:hypothetical protein
LRRFSEKQSPEQLLTNDFGGWSWLTNAARSKTDLPYSFLPMPLLSDVSRRQSSLVEKHNANTHLCTTLLFSDFQKSTSQIWRYKIRSTDIFGSRSGATQNVFVDSGLAGIAFYSMQEQYGLYSYEMLGIKLLKKL